MSHVKIGNEHAKPTENLPINRKLAYNTLISDLFIVAIPINTSLDF